MGGNPAENHPVGFKWFAEAQKTRNAKLVAVDPRFTRTAAVADLYSPIRAGPTSLPAGPRPTPSSKRFGDCAPHRAASSAKFLRDGRSGRRQGHFARQLGLRDRRPRPADRPDAPAPARLPAPEEAGSLHPEMVERIWAPGDSGRGVVTLPAERAARDHALGWTQHSTACR
jgi:hypothetical protein